MELTTKGRYAVMAMVDLAKFGADGSAVPLSSIADRQHLSLAYLEQLFFRMRQAGLVDSVRGRAGGYRLCRPASEISIADVMASVEEETKMTRCGAEEAGCVAEKRCMTHGLWRALGDHIADFLGSVSLQDVIDDRLGGRAPRKPSARELRHLV
jgi:Rrf2 family protein